MLHYTALHYTTLYCKIPLLQVEITQNKGYPRTENSLPALYRMLRARKSSPGKFDFMVPYRTTTPGSVKTCKITFN